MEVFMAAHFQFCPLPKRGFPHLTASAFLSPSPGGPGGRVQSGVRNKMRIHRRSRSSREQVPQVHQSSVAPEQAWSGLDFLFRETEHSSGLGSCL